MPFINMQSAADSFIIEPTNSYHSSVDLLPAEWPLWQVVRMVVQTQPLAVVRAELYLCKICMTKLTSTSGFVK